MAVRTTSMEIRAPRRGLVEITDEVKGAVAKAGVRDGMCVLFIRHTSASLIIQENYDASARVDLERFMERIAPDGASWMTHVLEGADDMPAHLRSMLTNVSLSIPVVGGELALGTWQGVYLWEHRAQPSAREVLVSLF